MEACIMPEHGNAHSTIPSNPARANDPNPAPEDAAFGERAEGHSPIVASEEFWKLIMLEGCGLVVLGMSRRCSLSSHLSP